jgi:catechol 2,3-dioxygenase-like lactoylglutathione lyase family enzyme
MGIELDHLILEVSDIARSVAFYASVLGLQHVGEDPPFSVMRVTPNFVLLFAQRPTSGGEHLAFALPKAEFDAVFARIAGGGIPYGDRFNTVGSMSGPSNESGARGMGQSIYFFDPDRHLLEIRYYE